MRRGGGPLPWLGRELPIALLGAYLVWLVVAFHGREIIMLDHALTFDHWWYFHDRLRDGQLAQWNPFSLLGRIAVQWGYVPVSLMTPALVVADLSLERFRHFTIVGTCLVLLSVYVFGRITGYGRYLSLLPVLLLASSGFRYWAAFLHFATFLTVYPLAFGYLISFVDQGRPLRLRPLAVLGILLAVACLGLRLELMVYAFAFVVLAFASIGLLAAPGPGRAAWAVGGLGLVAFAAGASAWQLAFLLASTLESARFTPGVNLVRLLDPSLLGWLLRALAFQPAFLLLLLNLALWAVTRRSPVFRERRVSGLVLLLLLAAQVGAALALGRGMTRIASTLEGDLGIETAALARNFDVFVTPAGLLAILAGAIVFLRVESRPALPRAFAFAGALCSGFAVSAYTGHTWPVNVGVHSYFVPAPLTGLLALGAVGLWLAGRTWILATLVAYHAIGEVGVFVLSEVFGIPWLPPRAAFAEMPLQMILAMEAARLLARLAGWLVTTLRPGLEPHLRRPSMQTVARLSCVALVGIGMSWALFPSELVVELEAFPFGTVAREITLPNGSLEDWRASPDGVLAPDRYQYHGGDRVARLERVAGGDQAVSGQAAACLAPGVTGDSWLRYSVPDVGPLKGRYVRFSYWMKGEGVVGDGVQVDVQDGVGPIVFERSNGRARLSVPDGRWERHSIVSYVDPRARMLLWTVNATPFAGGKTCVDDLRLEAADASPPRRWRDADDFPYRRASASRASRAGGDWLDEAGAASMRVRAASERARDHFHRVRVPDSVLMFTSSEQYYKFLPAYSQTLNTAPMYSSEIPRMVHALLRDGAPPEAPGSTIIHADMGPLLRAYKWSQRRLRNEGALIPYPARLTVRPHQSKSPLTLELLAEEARDTPRAFLSRRIVPLPDSAAEREYLREVLARGGRVPDQITTSDPAFRTSGDAPAGAVGRVTFRRDDPERVTLDVRVEADAYLALLDLWSPGWRARVDGRSAPIYRGYMGTRFVAVPAGQHTVEFTYTVPGLLPAAWISLLTWTGGLVALVTGRHR